MEILKNLNKKLCIYDDNCINIKANDILENQGKYRGATSKEIEELEKYTKFKLPEDYIEFLKEAMNVAVTSKKRRHPVISFWDIENIIQQRDWYPFLEESKEDVLVIGDDIGDYFLMYQNGVEGFGLYYGDAGSDESIKVSESISALLIEGEGLDKCFGGFE